MRKLLNALLILLTMCSSSYAAESIPKEILVKITSDCKKKYDDLLDSGITAKMREGAINHGDCLLESIEKYADSFFDEAQKQLLLDHIKNTRKAYFSVYDIIAQNNIACDNGYCGSMQSLFAYAYDVKILEEILQQLLEERYLHRNDIKAFDWDLQ